MLDIYTVSFFGHRILGDFNAVENMLTMLIQQLLDEYKYVDFLVGRDGDFDRMAASVIRRCRSDHGTSNSSLIWILPYETADLRRNIEYFKAYYDEIEVCGASASSHYKSAYRVRNRNIVDRSDLVICCVEHASGGAYAAMQYAVSKSKKIINLAKTTALLI